MWEQLFQYHNFARSQSYSLEALAQLINGPKDKQLAALSIIQSESCLTFDWFHFFDLTLGMELTFFTRYFDIVQTRWNKQSTLRFKMSRSRDGSFLELPGVKKSQNILQIMRLSLFIVCPIVLRGFKEGNIFLSLKNKQLSRMLSKAIKEKSPWRAARQDCYQGVAAFLSFGQISSMSKQIANRTSSLRILECQIQKGLQGLARPCPLFY